MKSICLICGMLMSICLTTAHARGPIVAVFDMEDKGSGLDAQVLSNLTDYLGVLLTKGGFQVVPRSEIHNRLQSQKKQSYKSCYDQSCQIELGRELAAEKTLATWILKIGKSCQVTATLYDLKKSTTELAAVQEAACLEDSLVGAIKGISEELGQGLVTLGISTKEAEIKVQVARQEAQAAREEARKRAEEIEKIRREVELAKKRAAQAEEAQKKAQQKVVTLEKAKQAKDSKALAEARKEAELANERAKQEEKAKHAALQKAADLEKAKQEAQAAKQRAHQAEKEKQIAEKAMLAEKEKARIAKQQAEYARQYPLGRPTESYNVGIGLMFVAPDITTMKVVSRLTAEREGTHEGGFGFEINSDFMLTDYLSLGGHLGYSQGEYYDPDAPDAEDDYLDLHIISVFASLKTRLNLGAVEFRPGLAGGYQHLNGSLAGKVHGLGLSAFLETAFYMGRHFALTVDLGANIYPVSKGSDGDQTFTIPLLYVALGAEYCD
jgi:hypothetical protein